jgi:hypothetical protein
VAPGRERATRRAGGPDEPSASAATFEIVWCPPARRWTPSERVPAAGNRSRAARAAREPMGNRKQRLHHFDRHRRAVGAILPGDPPRRHRRPHPLARARARLAQGKFRGRPPARYRRGEAYPG